MKPGFVVKNIGTVQGRILVFGGVYSNLQSLQALQKYANEHNYKAENIFCTGDILGYCAQPTECIQLIKNWNIHVIAGNVELQIRNDEDNCGCDFNNGGRCDLFSRNWYSYTQSKIDTQAKEWLHSLPASIEFTLGKQKVSVVHGSWFHTAEYIFKSTDWSKKLENFTATKSNIILAGHCGLPFADVQDEMYWLNAGVIGMPANDGNTNVWFLTMEDNGDTQALYQFHQLEYEYKIAADLMKQNGLPVSYANTLLTGIWDNCEILPEQEAMAQGKEIIL